MDDSVEERIVDESLLETSSEIICKVCFKVFTVTSLKKTARLSARRHVGTQHANEIRNHNETAAFRQPAQLAAEGNDSGIEVLDLSTCSESSSAGEPPESLPAVLFGLMSLRFGFSEREANALLRLLKMNLDFSAVKNPKEVMRQVGVADAVERAACRTCNREGSIENGTFSCTSGCATPKLEKYVTADLAQQLVNICEDEQLYCFDKNCFRKDGRIRDVTDGVAYFETQIRFREKYNMDPDDCLLVIILNTDGVKVFQSSTQSLWPVFGTVCEISPRRRFRNEKIATLALWQGAGKPPLKCITENVRLTLDDINKNGLFISTLSGRKRVYVTVAAVTADLPARAFIMNTVGVNGTSCCPLCNTEGERVKKGAGTVRIYPPDTNGNRRTHEEVLNDCKNASEQYPINGFCGLPLISELGAHIDYGTGVLLDAMHGICLGVAKAHVRLLFTGPQRYLTAAERQEANRRYRQFYPPPWFSRNPQKIDCCQWKAADYRNWILYFSVPCLQGLLESQYMKNWMLLVDAYTTLNSSDIRECDVSRAGEQLRQFSVGFFKLFEENEFGVNFHGLSHYAEMVNLWGPLYCFDLFPFESQNGWLKRHSYGTKDVTRSLMRPLLGSQILQKRAEEIKLPDEVTLLRTIQGKRVRQGTSGDNWKTWSALLPVQNPVMPQTHPCFAHELKCVATALIGNVIVWTDRYRRAKRTMAKFFLLKNVTTGQQAFVRVTELLICLQCRFLFLVGEGLHPEFTESNLIHLTPTNDENIIERADTVDLQDCVTRILNDCVEVILVEKTRYSD